MNKRIILSTLVLSGVLTIACSGPAEDTWKTTVDALNCDQVPAYQAGVTYSAGNRVMNAGALYECKAWPYSGWCGAGPAYSPGVGFAWQDAWIKVDACSDSGTGGMGTGGTNSGGTGGATGGSATGGTGGASGGTGGASGGTGGASGGTGGTGGTGGSGGTGTASCPAGSQITAVTASAGHANYGNVFGTTYYQANTPSTANPQKIQVKVTNDGAVVSGCEVAWTTAARNGWVFPDSKATNTNGTLSAYWTAGDLASQLTTATINLSGGGTSQATITGSAQPGPTTRGDSIHFTSWPGGNYTEYKVQVTPEVVAPTTYFETQGWVGAYGGIQFDDSFTMVLFSVWDTNGLSSKIMDAGACNQTVSFGGEGTGTSCRLRLPPSQYGAVPGLPSDYTLKTGDTYETRLVITYPTNCGGTCTDYTFYFTDVTRGLGPISLGTQRFMQKANNNYNDIFIEDWGSKTGDTCISAGARTARFHDMQAKINGLWKSVTSGTFHPNYVTSNTEVCSNYYAAAVSTGDFLLSSGGSELVSRPLLGGSLSLP